MALSELFVIDVVFLVVHLPSIVPTRFAFIAARVSGGSSFRHVCHSRWLASILPPSNCFSSSVLFLGLGVSYLLPRGCASDALGMFLLGSW
ncbi:hypothetical protein DY000_02016111 [Brassica cretica]|uniref:Secreted protein n=1 Tax=Brassica cretica TaxID=69181 RepID=A0ABQ7D9Z4_BRACR|nr:hypothetical protein DY000_02016111 [Brassica cretica]